MFDSQNNLSKRSSTKAVEEIFTDNDVTRNGSDISPSYTKDVGFSFDYPMRWLNDPSEMKAIGLRRCKVIPTSHVITIQCGFKYTDKEEFEHNEVESFQISVTPDNTFDEIIAYFITQVNEKMKKLMPTALLTLMYEFDYRTGVFSFVMHKDSESEVRTMAFHFVNNSETDKINLEFFLKFLNQERTNENIVKLTTAAEKITFENVWDRKSLVFHASFSDARRGYIGLNGDAFDRPSKFYDPPTNESNFQIRFTTDGIHNILPRYCHFIVELSFIYNYKNSLITK